MDIAKYCLKIFLSRLHYMLFINFFRKSEGLSGRNARKLPFLAYAKYTGTGYPDLSAYLTALEKAVDDEFNDRKLISTCEDS
jgi:hypothetical protein